MTFLARLSGEYASLLLLGVGLIVLLSVGVIAFFVVYQRRLFAEERARTLAEQAHQRELLAASVSVQESERARIARNLHDEIGSLLTAARLYLRQLPTEAPGKTPAIREQSLAIVDDMIHNTRRITHDLLPPTLEKFGFQAAAEDLCVRIDRTDSLRVTLVDNSTDRRLRPAAELALYRILQELLNNTLKYAAARTVSLKLDRSPTAFTFLYTDDGRGFDPALADGKGLGLRNIEGRVSVVGGRLERITSPGNGLRVTITLPLPDNDLPTHAPAPPTPA